MAVEAPREGDPTSGDQRSRSRSGRGPGKGSPSTGSLRSPQRTGQVTTVERMPDGQYDRHSANGEISLHDRKEEQQLRQEQATFEQLSSQDKYFFRLRMAMGIVAIFAILVVITICSLILFGPHQDVIVKRVAESTLFFSLIGLMGYVWRVFLDRSSVSRLQPVTRVDQSAPAPIDQKLPTEQ